MGADEERFTATAPLSWSTPSVAEDPREGSMTTAPCRGGTPLVEGVEMAVSHPHL